MDNIYILNLTIAKNNYDCEFLDAIVDNGIFYTLEEAISYGKWVFVNMACNEYDKEIITDKELDKFINDNKIEYRFIISIVSSNRKRFNSSNDIMDYFNSKIKFIFHKSSIFFILKKFIQSSISKQFSNCNLILKKSKILTLSNRRKKI